MSSTRKVIKSNKVFTLSMYNPAEYTMGFTVVITIVLEGKKKKIQVEREERKALRKGRKEQD